MAEMGRIMMHSKDRRRLATVSDAHALAQFLLVRRRAVQPADVGLPTSGRQRVAGLRLRTMGARMTKANTCLQDRP
jgi:hypothetical protein